MHAFALLLVAQPALGTLIYSPDPAKWYAVPPAKDGYRSRFLKTRNSGLRWFITADAKNARVIATSGRGALECAVEVDDGALLLGYNHGEFGGAIMWFSEDRNKHYRVYNCNPNQIIRTKGGLFVIEGLAHLSINYGRVLRLSTKDGKWSGKEFARLPAMGCAAADPGDGSLIVATSPRLVEGDTGDERGRTSTKLVRVTNEGKVETLLDLPDCSSDPTSVAIAPSGIIYIGMRQFVIAFDPKAKQPGYKLLVPRAQFLKSAK